MSNKRRDFLKKTMLTGLGITGISSLSNANNVSSAEIIVPANQTILFQGDSITDAGRNRGNYYANDASGLGNGYVYQIAAELLGSNPNKNLRFYNRGISGNKVYQLAERWDDDCLNLKPDILSIMIGVNDFWHTLSYDYKGTADSYEADFRKLLERTLKELPHVKLIIAEPFSIKDGSAISEAWKEKFPAYQSACRKIATEFKAVFIPLQQVFDKALKEAPVSFWGPDGVHPSIAGGYLMKNVWLEAIRTI